MTNPNRRRRPRPPHQQPAATPFTPDNVRLGGDGRWYHDGVDVTDRPVAWRCQTCGHKWTASLAERTPPNDQGCPECADGP